jgi:hypothetical protein
VVLFIGPLLALEIHATFSVSYAVVTEPATTLWRNDMVQLMDRKQVSGMEKRDWSRNRALWIRVLETKTGEGVVEWMRRIERAQLPDEAALHAWLSAQNVTGYARTLLIMERFGYPDFLHATADELIDNQYADRVHLRAIHDTIIERVLCIGPVHVQARKTYVSLVTPRRTFARVQPTTKRRVDLGLRLDGLRPVGRLERSTIHETMKVRIALKSPEQVDDEATMWLERAYWENS